MTSIHSCGFVFVIVILTSIHSCGLVEFGCGEIGVVCDRGAVVREVVIRVVVGIIIVIADRTGCFDIT